MTAVAVWDHEPTADELLADRLERGWRPIPSNLIDGSTVLGHACSVSRDLWDFGPAEEA